ncbi:MAG: hypothetical protein V4692_06295 [Bdellovibrionota bacterium]
MKRSQLATLLFVFVQVLSGLAFASGGHGPTMHEQELHPSPIYNGNSPIDLSHGLFFNNGTFGLPNAEIEEWAKLPVVFPGISEKGYSYDSKAQRESLIREAKFQLDWGHAAIANYESTSADSRPEAIEHSKAAIAKLDPPLERLEAAIGKLKSAGKSDWDGAQAEVRRAIIDLRMAYTQMHKNSRI